MNSLYDVAIVGYGPVGKVLAILLAQKGHSVVVVERWQNIYPLPRAVVYDHEIARLFQSIGIQEELKKIILRPSSNFKLFNGEGVVLPEPLYDGIDSQEMGLSGWPSIVNFAQPQLEKILENKAKTLNNLTAYQGWEVQEVKTSLDSVTLTASEFKPGCSKTSTQANAVNLKARYVVGADGANSFIRKRMGSKWIDLGFAYNWLVVDIVTDPSRVWDPVSLQLCDIKRPTTLTPGGIAGRRRFEFMLLPGESMEEMNNANIAWQLLKPWDITPTNTTLERHAVYTFRSTWADNWRADRMLIAGDAAHLMPPFLGQGMCSGIRDAAALAWRLDLVLNEKASDALLDSYGPERSEHVKAITTAAVELGKKICVTDAQEAAIRDAKMLSANPEKHKPFIPKLGKGLGCDEQEATGTLTLQGKVLYQGIEGLFDDRVGRGFVMMSMLLDPIELLSEENRLFWERVNGISVFIGEKGTVQDPYQEYKRWFGKNNYEIVVARPDFYILGTPTTKDINPLIDSLRLSKAFQI